ncbi:MAG: BREX-1 system adenine-specific DNA-methyltransferase PglX [Sulfurovum sp.]|nr:BREX-1 system adenine-specific DNA-methyltransferase PglX [Sulfurovum sp.]
MSIFQPSVLKNVSQDESIVAQRWAAFQAYLAKTDFIKEVKEEKYQDGFFKDVFENALGYTLDSTDPADFNLEREKKNETDAKKADGVIYAQGEVIGVVELKDQKTKNLDAIEAQAFNYHNSHANSRYIIISNFDELRFYIDKKTAYEKFSLFSLNYEEFKKLHLLLSFESIKEGLPLKLKEKSANFEQQISKELYRDFSQFRTHLFENIIKNNYGSSEQIATSNERLTDTLRHPAINTVIPAKAGIQSVDPRVKHEDDRLPDKQTLLRLTQKLCDRIIFILFAEDRGLLTPNTIKEIREEFQNQKFTSYTLYDIYKFYFNAINEGNEKLNIPRYNGGLFAKDDLLDSLVIEDAYLDLKAQKLSDFDFVSDISVNILGHIFEQSLTDLEEMNASINETEFDKKKSKRKKDGVFYTPEYITRYIVENTLGKLCEEKKASLGLTGIEEPQNPKKLTKAEKETLAKLYEYRDWLLNLKILDPACGSGAFLNQALEFLIREHKHVDDYRRAYENEALSLYDIETNILEHNLYGVDINEDAVEIAKLSLWLRTAHRGRELTSLANKIKCGNSLIADRSVAENAFVWEEEFPEVFAQGGFDVVIGNPPYTYRNVLVDKFYFQQHYISTQGNYDLYKFFMEKTINLVNKIGLIGMIVPNTFLSAESYSNLRKIIIDNTNIKEIYDLGLGVFENVIVESIIYILGKQNIGSDTNIKIQRTRNIDIDTPEKEYKINLINSDNQDNEYNIYLSNEVKKIINKMNIDFTKLSNICYVTVGINTGYIKDDLTSDFQKDTRYHKMLNGKNIGRYTVSWSGEWILYDKDFVKSFGDRGRSLPQEYIFSNDKILIQRTRRGLKRKLICYLDLDKYYNLNRLSNVVLTNEDFDIKYIYVLLNSELMDFYFNNVFNEYEVKPVHLSQLPIKILSLNMQQPFTQKADKMLSLNKQLQETKQNFTNELGLEKPTKKLQNFEELEFEEFVSEYAKAKKLKFADKLQERNFKQEWQAIFENDKALTCKLKDEIAKTDKEIDEMVYKLYDLSEDEIKIVEGIK